MLDGYPSPMHGPEVQYAEGRLGRYQCTHLFEVYIPHPLCFRNLTPSFRFRVLSLCILFSSRRTRSLD
jgi:hypothetical protein